MNALIWKEIRQHAAWAGLATVFAAIAFAVALKDRPFGGMLCELSQQVTLLYAPVWALAIGLLQTLPETQPDRWALLVHRPLSMRGLFAGKAISGAILSVAPVLVPFAIAAAWTLVPGSIGAPIHADSFLPGLLDIACCLTYHAAGMAIGMRREGRRWLHRVLPLSLPLLCSFIVFVVPEPWQACAVIAIVEATMLTAACGVMTSGGEDASLARRSRLALVAASLPATMVPIGLLILVLLTSDSIRSMGDEPRPEKPHPAMPYYAPDDDGTVRLQTAFRKHSGAASLRLIDRTETFMRLGYRRGSLYTEWSQPKDQGLGTAGGMLVYFLPYAGGALEAFDPKTRRRLGYVGFDGVVPQAAQAPRLRSDFLKQRVLKSDDAVVDVVDGPRLAVRYSVHPESLISIAAGGIAQRDPSSEHDVLYVGTALHVHVVRPAPAPPLVIDRPAEAREATGVSIYPLSGERRVLLYNHLTHASLVVVAQMVDGDGHIISVQLLDPLEIVPPWQPTRENLPLPLCALVPPAVTIAGIEVTDRVLMRAENIGSTWGLWNPLGWIGVAITTLVAIGSTLALSRRRMLSAGSTALWACAAVPLGLAIPLMLLAVHPKVVRIACPRCGKPVPVTLARCPSCGGSDAPQDATAIISASEPVRVAV